MTHPTVIVRVTETKRQIVIRRVAVTSRAAEARRRLALTVLDAERQFSKERRRRGEESRQRGA